MAYLDMDRPYLWRWFFTDDEDRTVAQSPKGYFRLADASAALQRSARA